MVMAIAVLAAGCSLDASGLGPTPEWGGDGGQGAVQAAPNTDASIHGGGDSASIQTDANRAKVDESGTDSAVGALARNDAKVDSSPGSSTSLVDGGEGGAHEAGVAGNGSGGAICGAPMGGAACDPGVVPCGNTTCDTSQKSCCHVGAGAAPDVCVGPNAPCTGGNRIACNEASDCASGLVCCDSYGPTSCMASCSGTSSFQICRGHSECGAGVGVAAAAKRCILQACGGVPSPGGGPPSPVVTVEACAVQTSPGQGMPPIWGPLPGCTAK